MQSIKSCLMAAIEEGRRQLKVLSSLENPQATAEEIGEALKLVLKNNRGFWEALGKRVGSYQKKAEPSAVPEPAPKLVKEPTTTAPARTLELEVVENHSNEGRRDKLIGTLRKFVTINNFRIDFADIRRRLKGMLESGVEISEEHFKVIFAAAKKADSIGFYLIDSDNSGLFYRASPEMVDDYVFGQDGRMIQVLAMLSETPEGEEIPRRVAGAAFALLNGLGALKKARGLDEFQINRVEALLSAAQRVSYKKLALAVEGLIKGGGMTSENTVPVVRDRTLRGQLAGITVN